MERIPELVPDVRGQTIAKLGHEALDAAVAAAYGRPDYTSEMLDEEILRRLLVLNLVRTTAGAQN